MREIKLRSGHISLVDDDDFDNLSQYKWTGLVKSNTTYAMCTGCGAYMHRVIVKNIPKGKVVNHINGNGLDNRKENLEIISQSENVLKMRRNTEGFRKYFIEKKLSKV